MNTMLNTTSETSKMENSIALRFMKESQQYIDRYGSKMESVSTINVQNSHCEAELSSAGSLCLRLHSNNNNNIKSLNQFEVSDSNLLQHSSLPLLLLPDIVMDEILTYLTYDEVAQMRIVSRGVNSLCQRHLNRGFRIAVTFHAKCLKDVQSKLPRRQSSRRNHPYFRHCSILSSIGASISLLSMTFRKFINSGVCCFIPGKAIDEIFRLVRICNVSNPPPPFDVLQELRDILPMAVEYFKETIAPAFKAGSNSPAAASAVVINVCQYGAVSTNRILSGPLGNVQNCGGRKRRASSVFSTSYSMPKRNLRPISFDRSITSRSIESADGQNKAILASPVESRLSGKINSNNKILNHILRRMRKMQNEMTSQRKKIERLEKLVSCQRDTYT